MFKDKEKRREWERRPEQVERARVRKERQREKRDLIARLNAVQTIVDRAGNDRFMGPKLRAQLKEYQPEIAAYRDKLAGEKMVVEIGPPKDVPSWSMRA